MESEKNVIAHAIVHGKVQGVFFRATTCNHAKNFQIAGTVKNMPDGTVEIYAKGSERELYQFFSRLKEEPGMGRVSTIEVEYLQGDYSFEGFNVVY